MDSEVLRSIGRQFGTVCHQLCEAAVCLSEDNNEHHMALHAATFGDRGAVNKCSLFRLT